MNYIKNRIRDKIDIGVLYLKCQKIECFLRCRECWDL